MERRIYISTTIFAMVITLCLLGSCKKGDDSLNVKLSPQDKSINELSTKLYGDAELTTISLFVGTMQELNSNYPVECIRETPTGYRVSYCGEDSFASILFDSSGKSIMGWIYKVSKGTTCFDILSAEKSVEDVMKIDPNGNYLFLYTGRNDTPKQSTHYTSDGYLITIEYDEKYFISNIKAELI